MGADRPIEDFDLVVGLRVAEAEFLRKAVDLGDREFVGPARLDVVLGGDHRKRLREGARLAVDGHLCLLHRL